MNEEPKPHLLVVDDEPAIRQVCKRSLKELGDQIDVAASGEEALAFLKTKPYDLVLTDLLMPGLLNGIRLLEEIKRRAPQTDVIMMTGYPTLETAIPSLKQGAYDYLVKPFDQDKLRGTVSRCLQKRHLSDELNREKRLSEELEAAYAQLHDMERLKEAFLARVNHELRTPMAPVFFVIKQLQASSSEPEHRKLCEILEQRLRRLQEVIENVLLFSDIRHPEFECRRKNTNTQMILQNLIEEFRPILEEKQLDVTVQWSQEVCSQYVDPTLIKTAYKHLLLNAIQFCRTGGRITIRSRQVKGRIETSFSDTGAGISSENLPYISDTFYQVAGYLTREVGGIGLGLAIVRRIIDLHGGFIRIQSRMGEGSTFTLVF